jgi:hypothetical protein
MRRVEVLCSKCESHLCFRLKQNLIQARVGPAFTNQQTQM